MRKIGTFSKWTVVGFAGFILAGLIIASFVSSVYYIDSKNVVNLWDNVFFNAAACLAVKREFETQANKQNRTLSQIDLSQERLTALQIDAIRKVAECAAADQTLLLEDQMSMLSSAYTIAPMLGLFGTVWGVMVAFESMGKQGMANLSAVAPGISSALLTTVVGLIVAIPSAFGSNKLNEKIRFLSVQMENFTDKFATRLQQSFLYE